MAKYPEKYEDRLKFYFNTLEDGIIKVKQLLNERRCDDIRLQLRPFSNGHKISVYATIKKKEEKIVDKDILIGILDVQNKLANEIKDIRNRLRNSGYE
jgi:hypothetical protein